MAWKPLAPEHIINGFILVCNSDFDTQDHTFAFKNYELGGPRLRITQEDINDKGLFNLLFTFINNESYGIDKSINAINKSIPVNNYRKFIRDHMKDEGLQTLESLRKKATAIRAKSTTRISLGIKELILLTRPDAGEDGIEAKNLPPLEEGDFEKVANDIKSLIDVIKHYSDPYNGVFGSSWGQQFSNFYTPSKESNVPKASIMHDARVDAYDIKFEKQGFKDWEAIKGVIAVIKATIPVSDRAYEPNTHTWSISKQYFTPIEELLKHAGFIINYVKDIREDFFYDATPIASVVTKETLENKLQAILGIGSDGFKDSVEVKKAYRKKALELHPDRNNGDGSRMSELNSLWTAYNA